MKKRLIVGGGVVAVALLILGISTSGDRSISVDELPTASAQQGDLVIDVLEGGNIQALNYLEYRNEVKLSYGVKLLDVIDEGYFVTEEDVA